MTEYTGWDNYIKNKTVDLKAVKETMVRIMQVGQTPTDMLMELMRQQKNKEVRNPFEDAIESHIKSITDPLSKRIDQLEQRIIALESIVHLHLTWNPPFDPGFPNSPKV